MDSTNKPERKEVRKIDTILLNAAGGALDLKLSDTPS